MKSFATLHDAIKEGLVDARKANMEQYDIVFAVMVETNVRGFLARAFMKLISIDTQSREAVLLEALWHEITGQQRVTYHHQPKGIYEET